MRCYHITKFSRRQKCRLYMDMAVYKSRRHIPSLSIVHVFRVILFFSFSSKSYKYSISDSDISLMNLSREYIYYLCILYKQINFFLTFG